MVAESLHKQSVEDERMPFDLMIFLAMLLYKSAVFYISIFAQMTAKMKVILFIPLYDSDYLAGCYSKVLPCSMI